MKCYGVDRKVLLADSLRHLLSDFDSFPNRRFKPDDHFPIQNRPNMLPSRSSVVMRPVISPK